MRSVERPLRRGCGCCSAVARHSFCCVSSASSTSRRTVDSWTYTGRRRAHCPQSGWTVRHQCLQLSGLTRKPLSRAVTRMWWHTTATYFHTVQPQHSSFTTTTRQLHNRITATLRRQHSRRTRSPTWACSFLLTWQRSSPIQPSRHSPTALR